jgi:hypothetical protein
MTALHPGSMSVLPDPLKVRKRGSNYSGILQAAASPGRLLQYKTRRDVADNQRVGGNCGFIADSNRSNDAGVTTDENMVADNGSAWMRSSTDGAPAMKGAICSDVGFSVDSYRAAVTDDHARSDLGIRM